MLNENQKKYINNKRLRKKTEKHRMKIKENEIKKVSFLAFLNGEKHCYYYKYMAPLCVCVCTLILSNDIRYHYHSHCVS